MQDHRGGALERKKRNEQGGTEVVAGKLGRGQLSTTTISTHRVDGYRWGKTYILHV
jgi:hypothetical protein